MSKIKPFTELEVLYQLYVFAQKMIFITPGRSMLTQAGFDKYFHQWCEKNNTTVKEQYDRNVKHFREIQL